MLKRINNINSTILITIMLTTATYSNQRYYNCRGKPIFYNNIKNKKTKHYKKPYNTNNTNDNKLREKIYGTWKKILKQPDGTLLYVTTTFYKNGNFYISAIHKKDSKKDLLYSKGKWYIKNRYLIEKTKDSNYATANSITKDKIVLITKKQFVYQTSKGKVFTYYKK